jgi:protein-tyrosine phosphatase
MVMIKLRPALAAGLAATLCWLAPLAAQALEAQDVERGADGHLMVRWSGADPVDVYVSALPDAPIGKARLVARADRDGAYAFTAAEPARPYFILRDERGGQVVRTAERLLPLEGGSNFRDVGGYPAAGGKHVRWGMIYRTAATPLLTAADDRTVGRLGIGAIIDLRSLEERQMSPDTLAVRLNARYSATDYPASQIFTRPAGKDMASVAPRPVTDLYRSWPIALAPQFRTIFQELLRNDGAVSYHCSAGQDRTGVATALILSALGVQRDVIYRDYLLSTQDRRPENEVAKVDPARLPGNAFAAYYAQTHPGGQVSKPKPLLDAQGQPYLKAFFDEVDARWGSVDAYLDKELGVDQRAVTRLRAIYLE